MTHLTFYELVGTWAGNLLTIHINIYHVQNIQNNPFSGNKMSSGQFRAFSSNFGSRPLAKIGEKNEQLKAAYSVTMNIFRKFLFSF